MTTANPSESSELKTIGLTPFIYCSNQPLFHVTRDVPLSDALAMASDFLFLSKELTRDAAFQPRYRPTYLGRALFDGDEQGSD